MFSLRLEGEGRIGSYGILGILGILGRIEGKEGKGGGGRKVEGRGYVSRCQRGEGAGVTSRNYWGEFLRRLFGGIVGGLIGGVGS